MRKSMTRVLLLALILALLCVGALAAVDKDTTKVDSASGYTVTPLDVNGEKVEKNADGKYVDVAKFKLEYTATNEGEQLVMLLLNGTTPTKDNIYYIDQQSSAGGPCTFTIYPKQLTTGTYRLMVASQTSKTAATIVYDAAYVLGDVDNDGAISVNDVTRVLQEIVSPGLLTATQRMAADVNKDTTVNVVDATFILQYIAGNKNIFANVG